MPKLLMPRMFVTDNAENLLYLQSWTKVLEHFLVSGAFFNAHRSNPPLTPQTMLDECIQNFLRYSTLYRVGEGELQENFGKDPLFRGNREMTEKYEYCGTVPRTLVQDCLNSGFWGKKSVFYIFPTLFRHFGDK